MYHINVRYCTCNSNVNTNCKDVRCAYDFTMPPGIPSIGKTYCLTQNLNGMALLSVWHKPSSILIWLRLSKSTCDSSFVGPSESPCCRYIYIYICHIYMSWHNLSYICSNSGTFQNFTYRKLSTNLIRIDCISLIQLRMSQNYAHKRIITLHIMHISIQIVQYEFMQIWLAYATHVIDCSPTVEILRDFLAITTMLRV